MSDKIEANTETVSNTVTVTGSVPEEKKEPETWECLKCTNVSTYEFDFCGKCSSKRPLKESEKKPKIKDWKREKLIKEIRETDFDKLPDEDLRDVVYEIHEHRYRSVKENKFKKAFKYLVLLVFIPIGNGLAQSFSILSEMGVWTSTPIIAAIAPMIITIGMFANEQLGANKITQADLDDIKDEMVNYKTQYQQSELLSMQAAGEFKAKIEAQVTEKEKLRQENEDLKARLKKIEGNQTIVNKNNGVNINGQTS